LDEQSRPLECTAIADTPGMTIRVRLMLAAAAAAVLLTSAVAAAQPKVSCLAAAGLTKAGADATATSGHEQRAASYDVDVSTGKSGQRPTIVVSVRPHAPAKAAAAARPSARVDRLLLRSPYKSEAIAQPASFSHGSNESEAVGTFDAAAVRALPEGDINVILFTPDGERFCRLAKKDRAALLGGGTL
jgi:hypothetical protein